METTIPTWLMLPIAIAVVIAIFLTTDRGRALSNHWRRRLGWQAGGAPSRDREFLLRACGGDLEEVERRIEAERLLFPELEEARLYRRAIRKQMASGRRNESS